MLRGAHPAERAPEAPARGLEWVGWAGITCYGDGGGDGHIPTLRARSVRPAGSPWDMPLECRLLANTARFDLISCKVSQNEEVSSESVEKACHSPYSQKQLGKSPLEILRFPFLGPFSHKELMAYFDHTSGFMVKMTKCRQCAHPGTRARRGRRYPHGPRSELLLGSAPHLLSAGILLTFSTDWF